MCSILPVLGCGAGMAIGKAGFNVSEFQSFKNLETFATLKP
jgi:hypothetical protein